MTDTVTTVTPAQIGDRRNLIKALVALNTLNIAAQNVVLSEQVNDIIATLNATREDLVWQEELRSTDARSGWNSDDVAEGLWKEADRLAAAIKDTDSRIAACGWLLVKLDTPQGRTCIATAALRVLRGLLTSVAE